LFVNNLPNLSLWDWLFFENYERNFVYLKILVGLPTKKKKNVPASPFFPQKTRSSKFCEKKITKTKNISVEKKKRGSSIW